MKLKIAHILMTISIFVSAIVLLYVDEHAAFSVDTQQALIASWSVVILLPLFAIYFYYQSFKSIRTKNMKSKVINWIVCILVFLSITLVNGFELNLFDNVITLYMGMILSVIATVLACMVETKKIVQNDVRTDE